MGTERGDIDRPLEDHTGPAFRASLGLFPSSLALDARSDVCLFVFVPV